MADSDDEYDRKRRDKFRGERSAGESYRSERRDDRRRDDWPERGRARADYRDYRGPRDRYSPARDLPPPKRMRPDWGEEARGRYGHDSYGLYGWGGHDHYAMPSGHGFMSHAPVPAHPREAAIISDMQTQPPMLTLKQFLYTQDDGISDSEILRKYSEYKLEFKRQQLNEFFVTHKDEEWFKNKYHPEDSYKRKEEQLNFLKRRVEVFTELLDRGNITSVSVDTNQAEPLLRLLDTVVIKLEGGTEEDLKALDEKPFVHDVKMNETKFGEKKDVKDQDDDVVITDFVKGEDSKNNEEENWASIPIKKNETKFNDDEENWDTIDQNAKLKKTKFDKDEENWDSDDDNQAKDDDSSVKDRKRSDSESSDSSSSDDNERAEELEKEEENVQEENDVKHSPIRKDEESNHNDESDEEKLEQSPKQPDNSMDSDKEKIENENDEEHESDKIEGDEDEKMKTEDDKPEEKPETIDLDKEKDPENGEDTGPRALHKTSSIFLRNLAPTITKAEIEAICKRYNGFLRVAIADPLVERRWFRRGWVTFKRDLNIKEICWNLNNIRLRDCELGAIVNRDLSRRVRSVNGITAHKSIVRSDIKLCAKISQNLDEKFNLWASIAAAKADHPSTGNQFESFGFKSNNPVLQNITDFLIEEASAEEEELLGLSSSENKDGVDGELIDRDTQLIAVLDKLILYLRIVHSVDFYNHCEYPYEDEMPNRCGIIHTRGPPPQNKITINDIQEYIKSFEGKMTSFLAKSNTIDDEELKNLGIKDQEAEVEKFIQANTKEMEKDKWICPLSGKKFKGPEFVRKHIFNKHSEKVKEVRKEVQYFNNYLKDPKRPQLPEHPGNVRRQPAETSAQSTYRPIYSAPSYAPPYAAYAPPMVAPPRPRGFVNRRGPGGEYRPIIHYRDLDAPREPVDFL